MNPIDLNDPRNGLPHQLQEELTALLRSSEVLDLEEKDLRALSYEISTWLTPPAEGRDPSERVEVPLSKARAWQLL